MEFDFEKGVLTPFPTVNYNDDKINSTVVPPKILLHKNNTKKVEGIFVVTCIYSIMSRQDKMYGSS